MKFKFIIIIITLFCFHNNISAQQPVDCFEAVVVCGSSNIDLDVNGIGVQELNGTNSCASQENNSLWLRVPVQGSGTLAFTLTPNSNNINEDYDFFIFGPNVECDNIGMAIRCSTTNPIAANQANNLTGLKDTETDVSEGPGPDGNSFVKSIDAIAGDFYYVVIDRPIGNSPFSIEWTGTALLSSTPTTSTGNDTTVLNIENCDTLGDLDDGITTFNLEINTPSIIGTQPNVAVTYHITENDANISDNGLTSPYTNSVNQQNIFAKITSTITGCFDVVPFKLIVNPKPDTAIPSPLIACDDDVDGNNTNGQVVFDLTSKNEEILNGLTPTDYIISYHINQADALDNINSLANSYYNITPNNQILYVRIEGLTNNLCPSTLSLNLIVNPIPEVSNVTLIQCDEKDSNDGFTIFNLNEANDDLTLGTADRSTKFFRSLLDAQNNINEVNANAYTNNSNPETLYVSIINNTTNCVNYTELILNVSTTFVANYMATPICEDLNLNTGIGSFNLENFSSEILTGLPAGLTIAYYETPNEALLEINPLISPYQNTTPFDQTIYARVENDNSCFGISEVQLTILKRPELSDNETVYYCLNTFPDVITLNSGSTVGSNFTYLWSTGETTATIQVNEVGNYTVTVTNNTGCTNTITITVEPSNIATIDDITIVDGNLENNTITILASGEGTYAYALFNEDGVSIHPFQESNVFNNVFPGIYTAAVKDIKNDCGIVDLSISVVGFPKFFTPNGDGRHDTWQVYGINKQFQPNTIIYILDRYGKLLKEINPLSKGWNGTYNGNPLPTNDYWFYVTLQDGRTFKNHFTLKR